MLFIGEAAMAMLHINSSQAFSVLLSCSITIGFYLWILRTKFKSRWLAWPGKSFCVADLFLSPYWLMSAYIHWFSAVLLAAAIYVIFAYTGIFTKRSGLIKENVKDAVQLRDYLIRNAETICLGRDFLNQQANIFALDAGEYFQPADSIKDYYKLDIMTELFRK